MRLSGLHSRFFIPFVKKYKRKIPKTWDFVQKFLCKKFIIATRKNFAP